MTALAFLIAAGALLLGAYVWWRVGTWDAAAVVCVTSAGLWAAGVHMAGTPRPVAHDVVAAWSDVPLIAYSLDEGHAIFLWVQRDEPIAYVLPWSLPLAKQLHRAGQEAQGSKRGMRVSRRGIPGFGEWVAYPEPVPPLPPKD